MDFNVNTEEHETRLEAEFRQILCIIKSSILDVNSTYNLSYYRAWLEKLNSPCEDKNLRNVYLIRLARQIQGNFLSQPFDIEPPPGPLLQLDHTDVDKMLLKGSSRFENPLTFVNNTEICKGRMASNESVMKIGDKKIKSKCNDVKLYNIHESSSDDCPKPVDETIKGTIGNIQEDSSSWYDLSDASLTSIIFHPLSSGDAARKVNVTVFKEHTVQLSDEISGNVANRKVVPFELKRENRDEFEPQHNVNHLSEKETKELKYPLKDTHYIPADWKKTIESLQLRLTETLTQNNELKDTIQQLSAQIILETNKRDQLDCYQNQLKESHMKEIQHIEKLKDDNLMKLEKTYQKKLEEAHKHYSLKLQELAKSYESKMRDLQIEGDNTKQDKDNEILRLSEIIQHECSRIVEEIKTLRNQIELFTNKNATSDEKIQTLQKCVTKMDKLFHKSEKEYLKQLDKLRQELEKKEKIAKIQLKSQKADLIARTSTEKQKQFDELINSLEVKYIKMLEYHETEVLENKTEDDEKIEYLKQLLDKYNIPYNIM